MNDNKIQFVGTGQTNNRTEQIRGILTSKIASKSQNNQAYYYGFFKTESQPAEIPIIFKKAKPPLLKGSQLELEGVWAKSNGDRPSFTCHTYEVLNKPSPPTLTSLQKEISVLLKPSLDKKRDWTETTDFLFKKLDELKKITQLSQLGQAYLNAYFLTENARYANYQAEHLEQANFNLTSYLARIASELDLTKRQMLASGWKEVKL